MYAMAADTTEMMLCTTCALVWGAGYEPAEVGTDNGGEDWTDYVERTAPEAESFRHLTVEDRDGSTLMGVCGICTDWTDDGVIAMGERID